MSFGKAKKQNNKIHIGSRAFDVFLIAFMIIVSIIFLYPFLNVIATSLSSNRMITTGQVTFFPKEFHLDGYKALFKDENILGAYWNTIVIAVGTMIVSLVLNSLMAYVMMAPEFVLRKPLSIILLITMFFSGGTVPTYLLIQNLGLYDSWWSLILPNAVSAYNIFIYRSFSFEYYLLERIPYNVFGYNTHDKSFWRPLFYRIIYFAGVGYGAAFVGSLWGDKNQGYFYWHDPGAG